MKNKKFIFIVLLAVIVLGLPYFLRVISGNPAVIGTDSYYDMRIADEILSDKSLQISDTLVELEAKHGITIAT